jgi:hypothetical protein
MSYPVFRLSPAFFCVLWVLSFSLHSCSISFSCSLSLCFFLFFPFVFCYVLFFFLCLLVLPAFFSCILSLFLRLCISFVPCPLLSSPLVSFCFGPLCSFVPLLVLSFPSSWPFSSFYKARECHAIASK